MELLPPDDHSRPSIESLLDEYTGWKAVLDRESDDYGAVAKLVALYRFAVANYANPLADLLLEAITAMESVDAHGDSSQTP